MNLLNTLKAVDAADRARRPISRAEAQAAVETARERERAADARAKHAAGVHTANPTSRAALAEVRAAARAHHRAYTQRTRTERAMHHALAGTTPGQVSPR
jgi:hypothetical protein